MTVLCPAPHHAKKQLLHISARRQFHFCFNDQGRQLQHFLINEVIDCNYSISSLVIFSVCMLPHLLSLHIRNPLDAKSLPLSKEADLFSSIFEHRWRTFRTQILSFWLMFWIFTFRPVVLTLVQFCLAYVTVFLLNCPLSSEIIRLLIIH